MAANNAPNLKVVVGADTSQFERGIKQAKGDITAFGSVSDNVLGKLGQVLGVDTKQVEQMAAAIRGMGQKLGQAGTEGESAFGKIAQAATAAGASIAAIGIAGAIAAFKALTAEAENFKNTVAGANIELQTQAYVQTYTQVMHDYVSETGKSVAEVESRWKKFWGTLGSNVRSYIASGALKDDLSPWSKGTSGREEYQALQQQAEEAGKAAAEYSRQIFEIDRQRSDNLPKIAELERTISENRRIMVSDTATLAEKEAARAAAEQAINDKYALQLPLLQERARLLKEMDDLAGSSVADVDATNQAQAEAIKLEGQQQDELRSLESKAKGITAANKANNKELEKHLAILKQIEDIRGLDFSTSGSLTAGATTGLGGGLILPEFDTTALQAQLNAALGGSLFMEVGVKIDKGSLFDLSQQVTSILTGLTESMSAAIGGLVGDLLTGGDAWGNFANAALSAFGDMATAVGKIAIECGVASLGIKAALESLGPAGAAIAIAAGTALVALGAAVKSGLSNVAAGNYSSSAGVASGSYGSSVSNDYVTRDVQVNVTGTLQADGDQLVAVLNNTANKKGYTT